VLNQIILVGRLVKSPEVTETESGKKMSYITLAIPRSFKNADGEYDTDFIDCVLWEVVAQNTAEYCLQGDIVGVKGRIQTSSYETDDGERRYVMEVVAEKISFLSSRKEGENEED
jgi:single-strand DNA-binding protein